MTVENLFKEECRRIDTLGVAHVGLRPEVYKTQLAFDSQILLGDLQAMIVSLEEQARSPQLMRLTRDRLKKSLADYESYFKFLSESLKPLNYKSVTKNEYSRLMGQSAPEVRVNSYFSHLGKDWSWGTTENDEALNLLKSVVKDVGSPETILTLGAGACRLPYELHRWLKPTKSLCADISPLLLSTAKKVIRGTSVEVIDFPEIPKDMQSETAAIQLSAPEALGEEFDFVVHDISEWGFKENSVDIVFTPWFIDAAPMPTPRLFSLINSVLKPGGYWINIGPLVFRKPSPFENYCVEEVLGLAQKSGFQVENHTQKSLPHMQNPLAAQWRIDNVHAFCARLKEKCEIAPDTSFNRIPEWMTNTSLPIQLDGEFATIQFSLMITLDLAMHAAQGPSVEQLAKLIAERHSIPLDHAFGLTLSTLGTWISSASYRSGLSRA